MKVVLQFKVQTKQSYFILLLNLYSYNLLIKFLHLINNQTTTIIVTEDHNINLLVDREYLLKDGKLTEINSKDSRVYDLKPYKELKI